MNTRKLVIRALLVTVSLMLSYIESLFPFFAGIPGMKLGLANVAIVFALFYFGVKDAFAINMIRILLSALLFGNPFSLAFSFAGAVFSFLTMILFLKCKGSIYGISIAGAVMHNVGQIIVAYFIVKNNAIGYYMPVLMITGIVTGFLIALITKEMIKHVK